MSKRFGRNQKRAMRQEIAARENRLDDYRRELALITDVNRRLLAENEEMRSEIQDAKDVLGANFIGFRLTEETKGYIRLTDLNYPRFYHIPSSRVDLVKDALQNKPEVMRRVPLNVLALSLDEEVCRDMVHIRLRVDGAPKVAYGLAGMELKTMPRKVLIKRLTEEFARLFVAEMTAEKLF